MFLRLRKVLSRGFESVSGNKEKKTTEGPGTEWEGLVVGRTQPSGSLHDDTVDPECVQGKWNGKILQ